LNNVDKTIKPKTGLSQNRIFIGAFVKRGFTLVELAAVIVIIGLLVAGVTAGKSIIDQSRISRAVTDFKAYASAIQIFQSKYNGLPGDYLQGFQMFPNCGGNGIYQNGGDGNGSIDWGGAPDEDLKSWCHLSKAQLVKGDFTGGYVFEGGTWNFKIGVNTPEAPFKGSGYWLASAIGCPGCTVNTRVYGLNGNRIVLGRFSSGSEMMGGALTPEEAFTLDTKMDDGIANLGKIITINGIVSWVTQSGCLNGSNQYITATSGNAACNISYFFE
jgi:prepilin-type N-terminal cleavage/methylation domain-containing protein